MKPPDPPIWGNQGLRLRVSDTPYSSIPVDVIVVVMPQPLQGAFLPLQRPKCNPVRSFFALRKPFFYGGLRSV